MTALVTVTPTANCGTATPSVGSVPVHLLPIRVLHQAARRDSPLKLKCSAILVGLVVLGSMGSVLPNCQVREVRLVGKPPTVLFFFCGCTPCQKLGARLASVSAFKTATLVGVTRLGRGDQIAFSELAGIQIPIETDQRGVRAAQFAVERCPAVRVVRGDSVVYRWDLDNRALSAASLNQLEEGLAAFTIRLLGTVWSYSQGYWGRLFW